MKLRRDTVPIKFSLFEHIVSRIYELVIQPRIIGSKHRSKVQVCPVAGCGVMVNGAFVFDVSVVLVYQERHSFGNEPVVVPVVVFVRFSDIKLNRAGLGIKHSWNVCGAVPEILA